MSIHQPMLTGGLLHFAPLGVSIVFCYQEIWIGITEPGGPEGMSHHGQVICV